MSRHRRWGNRHHRHPCSLSGKEGKFKYPPFVIWVNPIKHDAWHRLFNNMTPEEIFEEINKRWLDPRFKIDLQRL